MKFPVRLFKNNKGKIEQYMFYKSEDSMSSLYKTGSILLIINSENIQEYSTSAKAAKTKGLKVYANKIQQLKKERELLKQEQV